MSFGFGCFNAGCLCREIILFFFGAVVLLRLRRLIFMSVCVNFALCRMASETIIIYSGQVAGHTRVKLQHSSAQMLIVDQYPLSDFVVLMGGRGNHPLPPNAPLTV